MKELRYGGNLFLLPDGPEAAVVTTNGIVKKDGDAVMGAGIAKYARDEYPGIAAALGSMIRKHGNQAYFMGSWHDRHRAGKGLSPGVFVATMPTKHDWRDPSDLDLIRKSARELVGIADRNNLRKIYLPAPGCSNGRLDYASQVRPAIRSILDGRFVVCLQPDVYDAVKAMGQEGGALA